VSGGREHGRVTSVLLFVVPFLAAALAIGAYFVWRTWIAPPPFLGYPLF
jgi:hypothetical protein